MAPNQTEVAWALAGNVVVGIGAGTATLAAFAPTLPAVDGTNSVVRVGVVALGFAVFFAGYGVTQLGTHRDGSFDGSITATDASVDVFFVLRAVAVVLGLIGLGAGMRLFALTIQGWDPVLGLATGLVCITGYVFGHIGINGVVL